MDISADERRRAFSVWLRTGRLPEGVNAKGVEFKFNPWHDPEAVDSPSPERGAISAARAMASQAIAMMNARVAITGAFVEVAEASVAVAQSAIGPRLRVHDRSRGVSFASLIVDWFLPGNRPSAPRSDGKQFAGSSMPNRIGGALFVTDMNIRSIHVSAQGACPVL